MKNLSIDLLIHKLTVRTYEAIKCELNVKLIIDLRVDRYLWLKVEENSHYYKFPDNI